MSVLKSIGGQTRGCGGCTGRDRGCDDTRWHTTPLLLSLLSRREFRRSRRACPPFSAPLFNAHAHLTSPRAACVRGLRRSFFAFWGHVWLQHPPLQNAMALRHTSTLRLTACSRATISNILTKQAFQLPATSPPHVLCITGEGGSPVVQARWRAQVAVKTPPAE